MSTEKNIILYVGTPPVDTDAIRLFEKETGRRFRIAVLYDVKRTTISEEKKAAYDILIPCKFSELSSITKALLPYRDEIIAVTGVGDKSMPYLQKAIPHLPYLRTPSAESLLWATSKTIMRERFRTYDKTIAPAFTVVRDASEETIAKIRDIVGFPLVVKPAGLAESMLVSICYHEDELRRVLGRTLKKINALHKSIGGRGEPIILVEEFMEGKMYSIDGYVNSRGTVYFCPMVYVKTGRAIGFDDFFGYEQITPTILRPETVKEAEAVAEKAVKALCLRSTTVHIELMRTPEGWKVIELGPRKGGFRHQMYMLAYGINHTMNDVLIRIPERPIVPKKAKGYAAAMKFFARKEGKLRSLGGIKKMQTLASFHHLKVNKKIGDLCRYAKHGGKSVFNVILFNTDRSALLADIRRLEQMISIETE